MRPQKIKKGRKGIIHLPRLLKKRSVYSQRIAISTNMTMVSDACRNGWSKLWGISFGHHHWHSSYRFVFRNTDEGFVIGYYAYINGVSPQDNKRQKGEFKTTFGILPKDTFKMSILEIADGIMLELTHEHTGQVLTSPKLPKPKSFKWLITELYPNLKCKQNQVTTFQFLK